MAAYAYTAGWSGKNVTYICDSVPTVCNNFGYDELNRLTALTVTTGTVQNFTYTYHRYGNRWAQNALQGGPALSISFNQAINMINTSGFTNDAIGDISNDTFHSYSYDADGNLVTVDGGATATYYYDSLEFRDRRSNHQIKRRGLFRLSFQLLEQGHRHGRCGADAACRNEQLQPYSTWPAN